MATHKKPFISSDTGTLDPLCLPLFLGVSCRPSFFRATLMSPYGAVSVSVVTR